MNILDAINNNFFLKKLFPNGLKNFYLGQLHLNFYDQININLHCASKPDIEIAKYGIWGKDYNIIVIELTAQFIKKLNVVNWQNNNIQSLSDYFCECEVNKKENDCYSFVFKGNNWTVEIESNFLNYQGNSIYTIDDVKEYGE
jgi:hypothetical protein